MHRPGDVLSKVIAMIMVRMKEKPMASVFALDVAQGQAQIQTQTLPR